MKRHSSKIVRYMAIAFFLATVLVLTGCDSLFVSPTERTIAQSETEGISVSSIPFTSKSVLDRLNASDVTIIPWKLARTLTYIEFRGHIAEEHDWTHTTLSEYPVVIYDTQSRPQYYEFIVQNPGGEAVGTITAHGRKVSTEIVSHILPFVRDYEFLQTKGDSYAQVASIYPHSVLIGIPGKSGDDITLMLNPVTGEADTPVEFGTEEETIAKLRAMSPEKLQQVAEISHAELEQQIIQGYVERQQRETQVTEYWSHFSSVPEEAVTISDEEIDQRFAVTKRDRNVHYKYDTIYLAGYHKARTRWGGWCAPSSIAWVYRLFYDEYNGTYLPLHGDNKFRSLSDKYEDNFGRFYGTTAKSSFYNYHDSISYDPPQVPAELDKIWQQSINRDGGLYYDIARAGQIGSDGVIRVFDHLNDIVRTITHGANSAPFHLLGRIGLFNQIYNQRKPVFVAAIMNGGRENESGFHQIVLSGVSKVTKAGETQFLFWWIPWEHYQATFYQVHDNGYITGHGSALNGESDGTYLPFWVTEDGLYNSITYPYHFYWE